MVMKKLALVLSLGILLVASCKKRETAVTETAGTAASTGTSSQTAGTTAAPSTAPVGIEVGSTMPEYAAAWLDGSKFELASRRDKVVLLNVWATWCGPCRYEIPELQRMHNEYAAKGFEVIGVSVDEGTPDGVKAFAAEQKMTYPLALDPDGNIANLLQTSVLPTTVLVDRTGKIVWKRYGAILENDAELKKAIETSL
jgi:thiol-disulfide isomerase/thioredoxin